MNKNLKVSQSATIHATPAEVWEALTNPEKIKLWLYGTHAITDWSVGSVITFQGEYEGHRYKDKGNVLESIENEKIRYNYWSGFSGLEDQKENYSMVTYEIEKQDDGLVNLTWRQEGFVSEAARKHTKEGLESLLKMIKEVVEGN